MRERDEVRRTVYAALVLAEDGELQEGVEALFTGRSRQFLIDAFAEAVYLVRDVDYGAHRHGSVHPPEGFIRRAWVDQLEALANREGSTGG